MDDITRIEQDIVIALRTVYDPEIPVNVYDLGLIYDVNVDENHDVKITMTLTAPNCPMVDILVADIKGAISAVPNVKTVNLNITFDPPWSKDMLSDEAKLELGLL